MKNFERNNEKLTTNELSRLPIYEDSQGVNYSDGPILKKAVEIINNTIHLEGYLRLGQLKEKIGHLVVSTESNEGILIEDEINSSALRIYSQESLLLTRTNGRERLQTTRVLDIINSWIDIKK